jgi:hypothetical protein
MMTKPKAIILACSALLFGIIIAGLLASYVFVGYVKFTASGMQAQAYTSAAQSVRLLDHLRQGDAQSLIEQLETQLDGDLVSFWGFYKDTPAEKRDPHLLKLLAKIRDYRAKYPHTSGHAELDQTIQEILAWAR